MQLSWEHKGKNESVSILSREAFAKQYPQLMRSDDILSDRKELEVCFIEHKDDIIFGTFVLPCKEHPIKDKAAFDFVLDKDQLFFVDDTRTVENMLVGMNEHTDYKLTSALGFLLNFMSYMISEDVYFIEEYDQKLQNIEEQMYLGHDGGTEHYIIETRRDMNIMANYYRQLSSMALSLEGILVRKQDSTAASILNLYNSRVQQLYAMVESVKDSSSQIWNLRQTQLSDRQNQISTTLTIITFLFLPLTFLTGWFGMNFRDMPFLEHRGDYFFFIGFCLLLVVAEVWYIRRKKLIK